MFSLCNFCHRHPYGRVFLAFAKGIPLEVAKNELIVISTLDSQ